MLGGIMLDSTFFIYFPISLCRKLLTKTRLHLWSGPKGQMAHLRVLQWNVLADGLAQAGDFIKKPRDLLEWSSRSPVVLSTLLCSSPEIMCLQEVNHFDDFFLPQLQQHGYSGIFNEKIASAACEYGGPPDGCAIFFKTTRFRLVGQEVFRFRNRSGSLQSQGAIICQLEDLEAQQHLIFATTHLKAKAGSHNEKLRLQQAEQLLKRLSDFQHKCGPIDIIMCGDFNAPPTSDVYKLVLEHGLQLRSAYAAPSLDDPVVIGQWTFIQCSGEGLQRGASSEPRFTTWKFRSSGEKKETIDYIWYSSPGKVQPSKRLLLPLESDIGTDALPSSSVPSDHLPLLCEFIWIDEKQPIPTTATRGQDHDQQLSA